MKFPIFVEKYKSHVPNHQPETVFGKSSIPERTPKRLLKRRVTKADALLLKKINKLKYFIQPWSCLRILRNMQIYTRIYI